LDRELVDCQNSREQLNAQNEKQSQYIEELLDGIKERERVIELTEGDKDKLEEEIVHLKKEIERVNAK
jgi:chromosome segregation ATPase